MSLGQDPAAMYAELESNQEIAADVMTRLEMDDLTVDETGYYQVRAGAFLKTLGDGTRADLAVRVNGEVVATYVHQIGGRRRYSTVEQIVREYIYGAVPEDELERRIERAVQIEIDGAPEVEAVLNITQLLHLNDGDEVALWVRSEERGTVASGVSGIELRPHGGMD